MIIPNIIKNMILFFLYTSPIWIPIIIILVLIRKFRIKLEEKKQKQEFEDFADRFTIGKNQKFLKCHFVPKNSKFTSAGFESNFKVYFSNETFMFHAKGFAATHDGKIIPKVTETWCESHSRALSEKETDKFFGYIIEHDADFLEKLKLCLVTNP